VERCLESRRKARDVKLLVLCSCVPQPTATDQKTKGLASRQALVPFLREG
jgi:hypothetical protein